MAFIREHRAAGGKVILATGTDEAVARDVAAHLGLFDVVLASDGARNLTGAVKAAALADRCPGGYAYIGNDRADLPVWAGARVIHAAGVSGALRRKLKATGRLGKVFSDDTVAWQALLRALRPHQWVKNLLVFVPLFTSHRWRELSVFERGLGGFALMCLLASSAYLLNDLADLENDRVHPEKRHRPLAAGLVHAARAGAIALVLLAAGLAAALTFGLPFTGLLLVYFFGTLAYSSVLKSIVLADVFTLAGLYTLRLLIGGAATGIPISSWLLAFAGFYFLSLAFVKRHAELHRRPNSVGTPLPGRGYVPADLEHIAPAGIAGGYVAVLVFALYVNSPEVTALYRQPQVLWLCCPVLLYWHSRIWLLATRGALDSDPVIFALKDRVSYLLGLALLLLVQLAR